MTSVYAEVIGDPIAHSKSPLIHNFWLQKLGIDAEYRATLVKTNDLIGYLDDRRADTNWRGCNVTMPLKLDAARVADGRTSEVEQVQAANIIVRQGNRLVADNSDVVGILDALPNSVMPPGSEVCVIGTGGAARAAFAAMKHRDVALVLVSARNLDVGRALMAEYGFGGCVSPLADTHNIATAEVIINATPLGMRGQASMPEVLINALDDTLAEAVVFDMIYDPALTPFLERAKSRGLRTIDGLAMLVGQAAAAFEIFFGQPAPRQYDAELRALLLA